MTAHRGNRNDARLVRSMWCTCDADVVPNELYRHRWIGPACRRFTVLWQAREGAAKGDKDVFIERNHAEIAMGELWMKASGYSNRMIMCRDTIITFVVGLMMIAEMP